MSTQAAIDTINSMARIFDAFAEAKTVLATLANAEQVLKETNDAVARKRAELAVAVSELEDARVTAASLHAAAKNRHVEAEEHFTAATQAAGAAIAKAQEKHGEFMAKAESARAQHEQRLGELQKQIFDTTHELGTLNRKIEDAKAEALRRFS